MAKLLNNLISIPYNTLKEALKMTKLNIDVKTGKLTEIKTPVLVVGLFEKEKLAGELKQLDDKLDNEISKAVKAKQFKREFKECLILNTFGKINAKRVLVVGFGKKEKFSTEEVRKIGAFVTKTARSMNVKSFVSALAHTEQKKECSKKLQACTEGAILSMYKFNKYKKDKKNDQLERLTFLVSPKDISSALKIVRKAQLMAGAVLHARDMVNEIPAVATPSYLASEAKKLSKLGINVKIFGKQQIKKMGMGCLTAVSAGSSQEPKFIVMQYNSKAKYKIALVGKGVTFDAGGINIKPTNYVESMKSDMAGAASVIAVMRAVAKLKPGIGVIGVVPACENLVGASAYKPGDILKAYNGKTIEVFNTDAEGRLILADALSYVEKDIKPNAVIDVATLTGACVVCLGFICTALIGNDDKVMDNIKRASESTDERVWELPLYDEFRETMDGDQSDVRNVSKGKQYAAGTITAGAFLEKFVGKVPWAHLDIAGTSWWDEPKNYCSPGATGASVRLLIDMIENWKK